MAEAKIHHTAIVDKAAQLGDDVEIGPYCVVGPNVVLRSGVRLLSHVCIDGDTDVGEGTEIYPFASIGHKPQDLKFSGESSKVIIGSRNSIREYVTIHPGTEGGRMETVVGDNCLLMAHVHVAHDCVVGSNIVFANCATLGGHVYVGDNAVLGGLCAVHQWVRIGDYAMIGGMSGVERDVVPYSMVEGNRATIRGLNILGLKRKGASLEEINRLKSMLASIFDSDGVLEKNVASIDSNALKFETEHNMLAFMKSTTKRSFCMPHKRSIDC